MMHPLLLLVVVPLVGAMPSPSSLATVPAGRHRKAWQLDIDPDAVMGYYSLRQLAEEQRLRQWSFDSSVEQNAGRSINEVPGAAAFATYVHDLVANLHQQAGGRSSGPSLGHEVLVLTFLDSLYPSSSYTYLNDGEDPSVIAFSNNSTRRSLQGSQTDCVIAVVALIVEVVSFVVSIAAPTLGASAGRAVGRAVATKMSNKAKNQVKRLVQELGSSPGVDQAAGAVGDIFTIIIQNIGTTGFVDAIGANVEWWEWLLAGMVGSGGLLLVAIVLGRAAQLALFIKAIVDVVENCDGVGEIGCHAVNGYDFYAMKNNLNGNTWLVPIEGSMEDVADRCGNICKGRGGFNTDGWIKSLVQPYDYWEDYPGECRGLFVEQGRDVCRRSIPGYDFYETYDSAGNDIGSARPLATMPELAEICDAAGSGCQGFNANGFVKRKVQVVEDWSRVDGTCEGLYVKKEVNLCTVAAGYTYYHGSDSPGNELKNQGGDSVATLASACNARGASCQGFTTVGSVKGVVRPYNDWVPGPPSLCLGLYVRDGVLDPACGEIDGYQFFPNQDSSGNDIRQLTGASMNDMAHACNDNLQCQGFNSLLFLKSSVAVNQLSSPFELSGLCQGIYVKEFVLEPPSVYCEGESGNFDISRRAKKSFKCEGVPHGKVKYIWRTSVLENEGFGDDEFHINLLQNGVEIYHSDQMWRKKTASGNSGPETIGRVSSRTVYSPQFECSLEDYWYDCEDGNFLYKVVDCGCPGGATPLLACSIESFALARDALCPDTDAPSSSPTVYPTTAAPTSSPSSRPTRMPVSPPASPAKDIMCFSGRATVQLEGRQTPVPMASLSVGDRVLTGLQSYAPVYAFGHKQDSESATYLRISTNSTLHRSLEMSHKHMVYVKGKICPVLADSVKVGDELLQVDSSSRLQDAAVVVVGVTQIQTEGMYAPLTPDGTIVVNGVLASNYIALPLGAIGFDLLHPADLAHWWLTPLRTVCVLGLPWKICQEEFEGVHRYVVWGMACMDWVQRQGLALQIALFCMFVLASGMLRLLEVVLLSRFGLVVVVASTMLLSRQRDKTKKTGSQYTREPKLHPVNE